MNKTIICPNCRKENIYNDNECRYCNTSLKKVKSLKKRNRVIVLSVLVLAVLSYATMRIVDWNLQWTEKISWIIPVDANSDGTDDLVVCYAPHGNAQKSLVRAVDLSHDRVLWERKTVPVTPSISKQCINADDEVLLLVGHHPEKTTIVALDHQNGKLLWQKDIKQKTWLYNYIHLHRMKVITFFESNDGTFTIKAFNKHNGTPAWQISMPSQLPSQFTSRFYTAGNKLFMPSSSGLYIVDLDQGTLIQTFKQLSDSTRVWEWRDRILLCDAAANKLFIYKDNNNTIAPYRAGSTPFQIGNKSLTRFIGIYKDNLVYIDEQKKGAGNKKNVYYYRISARSLLNGRLLYETVLPDYYILDKWFEVMLHCLTPGKTNSYFYKLPVRYLPLPLKHFTNKKYFHRYAVFDLEQGLVTLLGDNPSPLVSSEYHIFYTHNYYIISTSIERSKTKKKEQVFSLLFNGRTGTFEIVLDLKQVPPITYYNTPYHFWQVKGDFLYGFSVDSGTYWIIDIPGGRTLYHEAGGLDFRDGKELFKELFKISNL